MKKHEAHCSSKPCLINARLDFQRIYSKAAEAYVREVGANPTYLSRRRR